MEKGKLLPVIAAIMITSMAVSMLSFSTTTVSASHTQGTPTIDNAKVGGSISRVFTITVYNNGPDAVDNVRIIVPSEFTNVAPVIRVPSDNTLELAGTDNENVVLAAGTKVKLIGATTVVLYENTPLIRLAGDNIFVENDSTDRVLIDNVTIKKNATVNADLAADDNVFLVERRTVALDENDVVTLAETVVVRVSGNIVRLPENTQLKVRDDTNCRNLTTGDNVTTQKEKTLTLDDGVNWVTQEVATTRIGVNNFELAAGAWISIENTPENQVVLAAGSKVSLAGDTTVMLYENQEVRRVAPGATENVYLTDPTSAENRPLNWTQSTAAASTLPAGTYVEWNGIGENQIAKDGSLAIPIAFTVPAVGDDYPIYVKTKDINGVTDQKTVTLTVDTAGPTVQISALPSWVKENTAVTITVTASEPLAKLDNVMVAEKNAPENTQITMTPNAAKTVWTGTYTTGENNLRDNLATIYVIGTQFEDLVGNVGGDNTGTFTVDRMAPPEPRLDQITGWPTDAATTPKAGIQTKTDTWTLENIVYDNLANTLVLQAGMTVNIRVGTTVYPIITDATGYWIKQITLSEGTQEVGIQIVDKAGNASLENAENITLDTIKPSVTMISPASGALINDNKPLIRLTISDATLGIENAAFNAGDNSGYSVWLRRNGDNAVLATLTPKNPQAISGYFNSLTFENQWQLDNALPDNTYNVWVEVGDNLRNENVYYKFTIDTSKPVWTQATATANITFRDPVTRGVIPTPTKKTDWLIEGTAQKPGSTMYFYVGDTVVGTVTASTTAAVGGGYPFSVSITLSEGANENVYIKEIDTAGNESDKVLYGTYTVDKTPPVVTLTAPTDATITDAAQITVSGSVVDKIGTQAGVPYDQLTVRIDCTGAAVSKTVYLSSDGSFTATVPLIEGTNVINVYAADAAITALAGNQTVVTRTVTRTVTPLTTYAIILVVVALILAAIAIFRKEMK